MTTLYHYCNSATFLAIISYKSICLSSLTLSNDTMEGKLLYSIARKIIERYGYDKSTSDGICEIFELFEKTYDGLGFCMSECGDLLSQWRGYADDGKGFSIGFSKDSLVSLSKANDITIPLATLCEVVYSAEEQERIVSNILDQINKDIKSGDIKIPTKRAIYLNDNGYDEYIKGYNVSLISLWSKLLPAMSNLFAFKKDAFSEEKEWRLVSFLTDSVKDSCIFKADKDRIIPYRKIDLQLLDIKPIKKIIIGPKNITSPTIINKLLSSYGFNDVKIIHSKATYR